MKATDDPNHPKLKLIQEAMLRQPDLRKTFVAIAFEVGISTLMAWEKSGWLHFKPVSSRRWNSNGK